MGSASYDILVGAGLLEALPDLLATHCPADHYAVITDSGVAPLYGESLASLVGRRRRCTLVTFPAGEWNKTRESWVALTDRLLAADFGRDGAIIAVGGGVVGDLAGFVAATLLRGVPYVQVPTTLLAMIDSSLGGKTGVDTQHGKNLVGAFHQPRAVIADTTTLRTLPPVHRSAGMAEALKHAVVADPEYLDALLMDSESILAAEPAALLRAVRRSLEIKAAIVAADEREQGRRAVLNFGHTIGHAIEAVSGYALLHGEAVAMGMAAEAELGVRTGATPEATRERIRAALETFRLPVDLALEATVEQLCEVMLRDKKARERTVRFAFPQGIGEMVQERGGEWTVPVPLPVIREVLTGLGIPTS